jgi:transposase InsO family protein
VLGEELRRISRKRPRWGYRRAHAELLEKGWSVNRKRVQRLWREEGLRVPRRRRKRQRLGESTVPARRLAAQRPDHVWALGFQFDQTADGRTLKLLNVVDEFTREALSMKCERRIDADATVAVLDRLIAVRGSPRESSSCPDKQERRHASPGASNRGRRPNADERTRTSTQLPGHGPEPVGSRVDGYRGVQIVQIAGVYACI